MLEYKIKFDNENAEKDYFLAKISNKLMGIAAYNLKLEDRLYLKPNPKKVEKWREVFVKWSLKQFRKNLLPYYMSGSFTSHLYVLETSSMKQIQKLSNEFDTFRNYGIYLKELHPEFFQYGNTLAILVKIPLQQKYELVEENGKLHVRKINPFEDIWVVFHPDLGILEIRTKNTPYAHKIAKRLKEALRINCKSLKFSFDEMKACFEWLSGITNSHFRFETGAISSAQYTSALKRNGTRASLLDSNEFNEAMKRGNIISIYGYIPYQYIFSGIIESDINNNSEDVTDQIDAIESDKLSSEESEDEDFSIQGQVSFNINFDKGKIYFSTALSEIEVSSLIEQILGRLNLSSKRNLELPANQLRLNPLDYTKSL